MGQEFGVLFFLTHSVEVGSKPVRECLHLGTHTAGMYICTDGWSTWNHNASGPIYRMDRSILILRHSAYEILAFSRGDADMASEPALLATDADCLAVIGVKVPDWSGVIDAAADDGPATSARKRRRNACGVPAAGAESCGDGLTLGVVLRELLRSHWSTSWTSSLGVGPPASSLTSTLQALDTSTNCDPTACYVQ